MKNWMNTRILNRLRSSSLSGTVTVLYQYPCQVKVGNQIAKSKKRILSNIVWVYTIFDFHPILLHEISSDFCRYKLTEMSVIELKLIRFSLFVNFFLKHHVFASDKAV